MIKKFFKSLIKPSHLPPLLIFFSTLLIIPLIFMALANKPIADDYEYFSDPLIHNPISYTADFYVHKTGRISQAMLTSGLFRIFGSDTVVIFGTIIILTLLIAASLFLIWSIRRYFKLDISNTYIFGGGLFLAILSIIASPSLYDTYLWFTSSTVYLGSIIGLFIVISLALILLSMKKISSRLLILLGIVVFFAQLFSEPTSIITIFLASLCIVAGYVFKKQKLKIVSLVVFSSSILGFLFMYLSPGSRARQEASGSTFDIYNMFIASIGDMSQLSYLVQDSRWIIILLAAIIICFAIPPTRRMDKKTILVLIMTFLIGTFSAYILFVITRYSMGGYVPLRSMTIIGLVSFIAISTILAVCLSFLLRDLPKKRTGSILVTVFIVFSTIGIFQIYPSYNTILKSLYIRSALYESRETEIQKQLISENKKSINVTPAPILLEYTEAIDFYYGMEQVKWFEKGFKRFYNIPMSQNIFYNNQPDEYCVTIKNPTWFGAKPCSLLHEGYTHEQ